MGRKKYFLLGIVVVLGILLRFLGIIKLNGLWFDELLTWNISKEIFPFGILQKIMTQDFHFPLYYFLLHFWIKFFGSGEVIIRGLSFVFGVSTIVAAFFTGKELDGDKVGFILSVLVAVNSFLIYFSQEVRFYSLLTLLAFLSILFILKFSKQNTRINFSLIVVFNSLLLYTNVISLLFVFIEFLLFVLYFYKKNKERIKPFLLAFLLIFILFIPGLFLIINANSSVNDAFISPFTWWGAFEPLTIVGCLQNWFSPIFYGGYNGYANYLGEIFSNDIFLSFVIFAPVILSVGLIIFGLVSDRFKTEKSYVFSIGFVLFLVFILLSLFDLYRLLPRYTVLCFPPLVMCLAFGLSKIKSTKLFIAFFAFLLGLNLLCGLDEDLSTSLIERPGLVQIQKMLAPYNVSSKDCFFMGEGGEFLPRYFNIKESSIIPFMEFHAFIRGDREHLKLMMSDTLIDRLNKENSKSILKDYLSSDDPSFELFNYIQTKVSFIAENHYFFLIAPSWTIATYPDFVSMFSYDNKYKKASLTYLLMVKEYNDVLKSLRAIPDLEMVDVLNEGYWSIFIYKKHKIKNT